MLIKYSIQLWIFLLRSPDFGIVAGLAILVLLCASLPYMSISAGVVLAVALQKINAAPDAQSTAQSDHDSLQSVHCAVEKFHKWPHFLPRFAAHKIV